jgi:hypothetical protein
LDGPEHYEDAIFGVETDRKKKANFGRDVTLDLSSPQKEFENFCFPCNQILNSDQWEQGLVNAVDPDKFKRYMKFRQNVLAEFRNYDIPIIELKKNNSKAAVCLVFEKVNTGGVPLSVFELLTATYAADGAAGINLRKEWFGESNPRSEGITQRLAKQRLLRGIENTEFLQGLSLLYTFDCRKKDLAQGKTGKQATGVSAKREAVLEMPLSAYKQWKEPLEKGFWQAARFLRKESFFSTNDLPYRSQLVPLAAVLALVGERWLEKRLNERLSRWFWCGVLGEKYGGAVESRMALDVQELVAWLEGGDTEPTTVRDASFQPERLDTLRSRLSAAYKGINVIIQRNGAQDFFWKSTIRDLDETDWEECKLDIHHIFPRAWCDKQATPIPPKRYNSILNKTPISFKANRMIGGKSPSDYLKQLQTHKNVQLDDAGMDRILASHYIDPVSLRANDYEHFIERRRQMLINLIGEVMGKAVVTTGEAVAEDEVDEDDTDTPADSSVSSPTLAQNNGSQAVAPTPRGEHTPPPEPPITPFPEKDGIAVLPADDKCQHFIQQLQARQGETQARIAQSILAFLTSKSVQFTWHRTKHRESVVARLVNRQQKQWLLGMTTEGRIWIPFGQMRKRPPFDDRSKREKLASSLNAIGAKIPDKRLERFPGFAIAVLQETDRSQRFLQVLEWSVKEIGTVMKVGPSADGKDGGDPQRWDEVSFFETLKQEKGASVASAARAIFDWVRPHASRMRWNGGRTGKVCPLLINEGRGYLLLLNTQGRIVIPFDKMKREAPFSDVSKRLELVSRLNQIPGIAIQEKAVDKSAKISLRDLGTETGKLLEVLGWAVTEIKGVS